MLGIIRGFRYSKNANRLVDKLGAEQRVTRSTQLGPLYDVLRLNRIQGMIIEPFDYPQAMSDTILAMTTIIDIKDDPTPHGLIMSKKLISAQEQEKWRALVNQMRADGTVLRIFEKYFNHDLARSMVNF